LKLFFIGLLTLIAEAFTQVPQAVIDKRKEILEGAQKYWQYYKQVEAPKKGFDTSSLSDELPSPIKKQIMAHPIFGKNPPANLEIAEDLERSKKLLEDTMDNYIFTKTGKKSAANIPVTEKMTPAQEKKYKMVLESSKKFLDDFYTEFKSEFIKKYGFDENDLPDNPPEIWYEYLNNLPPSFFEKSHNLEKYKRSLRGQLINYFSNYVTLPQNKDIESYYDKLESHSSVDALVETYSETTTTKNKTNKKKSNNLLSFFKEYPLAVVGLFIVVMYILDKSKKKK